MPAIRPDLQTAEFSRPPFLTDIILPPLMREQIAGTLYYQAVASDVTAQSGRANASTIGDITEHIVSAASKTFSCSEIRDRQKMSYTQVKGYADLLHAELAMARIAKRAWFSKVETTTARVLLGAASPTDLSGTSADIASSLENAVAELQDKAPGKVALVLSSRNFTRLKTDSNIKDRMKNTGVVLGAGGDPRNVTAEQLAAILGVDQILIGPNDVWHTAMKKANSTGQTDGFDYQGNAALVVLPDPAVDPVEEIQLGRTIYYKWSSNGDFFVCESFHDDKCDADCVDIKGLVDSQVFNTSLFITFKLFA